MNLLGKLSAAARESMLEIAVNATAGGHDLSSFEAVDDSGGGYQATCQRCGMSAWVGGGGLRYSFLADVCPGLGAN